MTFTNETHRTGSGLRIDRRFTTEGVHPYDTVEWGTFDAVIQNWRDGSVSFAQHNVEFPVTWSQNSVNIAASKYFRGNIGEPTRERSLKQMLDRIGDTIGAWGMAEGYFASDSDRQAFVDEWKYLQMHQMAAHNSPVWFNIGAPGRAQQAAACFILDVEDSMDAILDWYKEEGLIFKGGSGAGVNLSKIRSSKETLSTGGTASGPVSFMRGADASAGTIKSGGSTRRAAKMVVLNVDHPDIEEFIWCKAIEERKSRVLKEAGFDMDLDGKDSHSIQYQNANNSVRVTDEFMLAVENGYNWNLTARTDGRVVATIPARDLWRQINQAAWECADPGLQFHDTTNAWNTTPYDLDGKTPTSIDASNPCSEHVRLANSPCNLASLNLLKFLSEDGVFDVDGFKHACKIIALAQDILVGNADYPTEKIAAEARLSRDIGIGFANLGALLMALGLPYDSDEGRVYASAVTALMTGAAAERSAEIAQVLGPAPRFPMNREPWLAVWQKHHDLLLPLFDNANGSGYILHAARATWENAIRVASEHGARNAELSVLAPTGTIGLMMDCDTTGIEPDLGLVKHKKLVGGGSMKIVNQTVPRALRRLGYTDEQIDAIVAHIDEHSSVLGAPHLRPEHLPVFACSMGDNVIEPMGHVRMMAACQPWISGAISKTVNMPEEVTVEDLEDIHMQSWKLGLKAVAVYRDNCKVGQPLSTAKKTEAKQTDPDPVEATKEYVERIVEKIVQVPVRTEPPKVRTSKTFDFRIADCKGFVTVGEYEDGRPAEIFIRVSKQGSTLAGIMDAFAISVSFGLQYGVPLEAFVKVFTNMRFEPAGMTDDSEIRFASSIVDYLFRRLALMYLPKAKREHLNIFSVEERLQMTLPGVEVPAEVGTSYAPDDSAIVGSIDDHGTQIQPKKVAVDAPICGSCGVSMVRAGSCFACPSCGTTSGCS